MQLITNFRNTVSSDEIVNHIDRRLSFALSRSRHNIEIAKVTLTDVNGPKGGVDKQCQIILKPIGMGPVVVTEQREQIRQAIDRCIARASQSLNRKLKRKKATHQKLISAKRALSEISHAG